MLPALFYRRETACGLLMIAGFCWLGSRLRNIQVNRHEELAHKARAFTSTTRKALAMRGEIRDRWGTTLAVSMPAYTVYADRNVCILKPTEVAGTLARHLGLDAGPLAAEWSRARQRTGGVGGFPEVQLLRRRVSPFDWELLTNRLAAERFGLPAGSLKGAPRRLLNRLSRQSVFAVDDQVRLYPASNRLAHVLGFVSLRGDGPGVQGMAGIERAWESDLAGVPGLCQSEQDAAGRELPLRRQQYREPIDGAHVFLTIDLRVQTLAEEIIGEVVERHRAHHGSILVLEPYTGEILAWACAPSFSPASPGAAPTRIWRNYPLQDREEPGSTLKMITFCAGLSEGLMTPEETVFCGNGLLRYHQVSLRDHARYGVLTYRQAFAKSSNVALAKLGIELGAARLRYYFTNFGLGRVTGVALDHEDPGYVPPLDQWTDFTVTRAPIGQGIAVTQIQLASVAAALVNGGYWVQPQLVLRVESPDGQVRRQCRPIVKRQVIPARVSRQMIEVMQEVLEPGGTGTQAAPEGFTAGGKTGTAQKANGKRYIDGAYYASFVGFFPASAPRAVIAVAVDQPQGSLYGGVVAAPAFRELVERIAPILGIAPDKPAPLRSAPQSRLASMSTD